ncbi:MAG: preprotein translocase subunit SecY [Planctomycetota bacterium]|nr:preprotein translocase subunit SecY [Planctomycetota bacterium]
MNYLKNLLRIKEIRNRILFTLGMLVCYRVGFFVPLPGINLDRFLEQLGQDEGVGRLFLMMNVLTGGNLSSATLFSLGVMPYISASIIFSLLTKVVPTLEKLSKEGASGQKKIQQYTRLATVVICVFQSFFVIFGPLNSGGSELLHQGIGQSGFWGLYVLVIVFALTSGTMFVMWLGEQITERGIGNGMSLIIMAGIIANLYPVLGEYFSSSLDRDGWQKMLMFLGGWGAIVVAVVFVTKAQRRIPIQQAKHTRGRRVYGGQRHFLPFKINQAGVMPLIFGSALLLIPTMFGQIVGWRGLEDSFGLQQGFWFVTCYVGLIFFFSFFWTSMMFQPNDIANNLKENGSFIPGIRPGRNTARFLEDTTVRLTLAGSVYLSVIAVLPSIVRPSTGVGMVLIYFMSGTSVLIVVSVALDMVEKINAMVIMRNYEGAMTEGGSDGGGGWGRRATT